MGCFYWGGGLFVVLFYVYAHSGLCVLALSCGLVIRIDPNERRFQSLRQKDACGARGTDRNINSNDIGASRGRCPQGRAGPRVSGRGQPRVQP